MFFLQMRAHNPTFPDPAENNAHFFLSPTQMESFNTLVWGIYFSFSCIRFKCCTASENQHGAGEGRGLSRLTGEDAAERRLAVTAPPPSSCQMTAAHMSRGAAGGAGFCVDFPPPLHLALSCLCFQSRQEHDMAPQSPLRTGRRIAVRLCKLVRS